MACGLRLVYSHTPLPNAPPLLALSFFTSLINLKESVVRLNLLRHSHYPVVTLCDTNTFVLILHSVCKARPDIRVRIRGSVIRIQVSDTAIRVRIRIRAVHHTSRAHRFPPAFSFSATAQRQSGSRLRCRLSFYVIIIYPRTPPHQQLSR